MLQESEIRGMLSLVIGKHPRSVSLRIVSGSLPNRLWLMLYSKILLRISMSVGTATVVFLADTIWVSIRLAAWQTEVSGHIRNLPMQGFCLSRSLKDLILMHNDGIRNTRNKSKTRGKRELKLKREPSTNKALKRRITLGPRGMFHCYPSTISQHGGGWESI